MSVIAHCIAISCYVGAAGLAATPFARPVSAPVRGVVALLTVGVIAHGAALLAVGREMGRVPLTGLGPALSFAGFVLALALLVTEAAARDVSLALVAAPLAALATTVGNVIGFRPLVEPAGAKGLWMYAHIALSFAGIAAFATAGIAGVMYLVERRELKSRRFGAVFRFFPPLDTLDRVNHIAAVVAWLGLTLGVALAVAYSIAYHPTDAREVVWGTAAWLTISAVALGRLLGGWEARRAAVVSSVGFAAVVAMYVVLRASATGAQFL
jgi:HemX protein